MIDLEPLQPQVQLHEELAFNREDFAYPQSWERFLKGERMHEFDFKDKDNYIRYILIDIEWVDWAVVVVSGLKRAGKSLLGTWVAMNNKRLFGKGATLNYRPKEGFGGYNYINEQSFLDAWVKLTEMADREDANHIIDDLQQMTKDSEFYNHAVIIDECKKWVWKRKPNARILAYMAELVDIAAHNHNIMFFMCPNAENIVDVNTIWEGRTHEVYCSFGTKYPGYASYYIKNRNTGKERWLHLSAADNSHLWESWNLIAMSKPITKKQMNEALNRARGNGEMERAVGKYKPDKIIGGVIK